MIKILELALVLATTLEEEEVVFHDQALEREAVLLEFRLGKDEKDG